MARVWRTQPESMEAVFAELAEGEETASGRRIREWAEATKLVERAGLEGLREAWAVADGGRRAARLTAEEFDAFVKEAEAIARERQSSPSLPVVTGAVLGGLVGGPPGAVTFAAMGGAYAASQGKTQSLVAGAAVGGLVAGPLGLFAGALAASQATRTYLGDPQHWPDFAARADRGELERSQGLGDLLLSRNDTAPSSASERRVALCGSGGGLRAATAFLGLLAEAEAQDFLTQETSHVVGVSGSCWSLAALYEHGDDLTAPLDVAAFLPVFRSRLRRDVRKPRQGWTTSAAAAAAASMKKRKKTKRKPDDDDWVFDRFAARRRQGHAVSASDVWGAHLATTLLDRDKRCGGYGLAALGFREDAPVPILTAVEARSRGPRWSRERRHCELCGRAFGYLLGAARHHCRGCGRAVCDACSSSSPSSASSRALVPARTRRSVSFGEDGLSDDEDDEMPAEEEDSAARQRRKRRCRGCVEAGVLAPTARTLWTWWTLSPRSVGPVDAEDPTPATLFGRRRHSAAQDDVSSTGGEPVGQLLGVVGAAFCGSVERYEDALCWSDQIAKVMRAIADPAHGDPGAPLVRPASFSVPDPLGDDGFVYLGDAGFSTNLPLPACQGLGCDVLVCLDASAYPPSDLRRGIELECDRAKDALATAGVDDVHFDLDAYASQPVSFHAIGDTTLLVVITLAAAKARHGDDEAFDPRDDDEAFDPLANAAAGGFCASSTASYEPADFDRLVSFVRARFRRVLPEIRSRIREHRSKVKETSS